MKINQLKNENQKTDSKTESAAEKIIADAVAIEAAAADANEK